MILASCDDNHGTDYTLHHEIKDKMSHKCSRKTFLNRYYLVELNLNENRELFVTFFQVLFLAQFIMVSFTFLSFCHVPGDRQYILYKRAGGGIPSGNPLRAGGSKTVSPEEIELEVKGKSNRRVDKNVDDEASFEELPESKVSICSRISFSWMNPMLKRGYKTPLTAATVFSLPKWEKTPALMEKFQFHWRKELDRKAQGKKLSLRRALRRSFGCRFYVGSVLKLLNDGGQFIGPIIQKALILHVSSRLTDAPEPVSRGVMLCLIMFLGSMIAALGEAQYFQCVMRVGVHVRAVLSSSIFNHALILSAKGRKSRSVGKMVLPFFSSLGCFIPYTPTMICSACLFF